LITWYIAPSYCIRSFLAIPPICSERPEGQPNIAPSGLTPSFFAPFVFHIFSKTPDHFADEGATINYLRWQGDLIDSGIIHAAPDAPLPWRRHDERRHGARPWLIELDIRLRLLFAAPEITTFVSALVPDLINAPEKRLLPARLAEIYNANVPPALTQPLRDFIAAQPDDGPPSMPQFIMRGAIQKPEM
jgi:hypothetical protein